MEIKERTQDLCVDVTLSTKYYTLTYRLEDKYNVR